jgi:myo-inositol-1(or 4)-monophosphatase
MHDEIWALQTTMVHAVELALQEIWKYWYTPVTWEEKGTDDRVTFLDKQIENKVERFLRERTGYGFMGEEYGLRSEGKRRWVLDPIDGTVNFTVRLPLVAVSLALMEDDEAIMGAIGEVASKRVYWSDGNQLYRGNVAIQNSRYVKSLDEAFVGLGTPRKDDPYGSKYGVFLSNIQTMAMRLRILGSAALGLTYVATGALDACLIPRFELWDVAAGRLLVETGKSVLYQYEPNAVLMAARTPELLHELKRLWESIYFGK